MKDDRINVFYSEEDEGYIADIPDLKYCSAFGETPVEAIQELILAKQAWIEAAQAEGKRLLPCGGKGDLVLNVEKQPLRILVVEDTADRQEILRSLYRAHAWVMVDSSHRAISLIRAYTFDLISLDYNIQGEQEGDAVARAIAETPNRDARIIIHSMNPKGAALISSILPDAIAFPVNKMISSNARFKRLREGLDREGLAFDWQL